jgi:glycosyltransferase involved in cell wall biosynthesis
MRPGKMVIGWIEVLKKVYGETIYTDMAKSILAKHHDIEVINVGLDSFKKYLYPKILYRLCRIAGKKDLWIRNFDSILTMPHDRTRGKNVALIFHIDYSFQPLCLKMVWKVLERIFYSHLKNVDAIVTISRYWQDHFLKRGYRRVHLIYNGYDLDQFHFEPGEVEAFKEKWALKAKPILYLGNCQRIKGVVEAYDQLKDMEAHLVTSGRREVDLPTLNLDLNDRDYLLLLKASSVVITLSKFKEGWNRTAHEAMLCQTPVIGSGLGGMRELLEGGGQIVCEDVGHLREKVRYALEHPELGEAGYGFARQFTVKRFQEEWISLIERVHEEK